MGIDLRTPKAKADKLLSQLLRGKDIVGSAGESLREKILIAGKPTHLWEEHFKLKMPDQSDMNPSLIWTLSMEIMNLHQEAAFLHAEAARRLAYLKRGTESNYYEIFADLVNEYKMDGKKIPAAATLESLAKREITDYENALVIAETEVAYWKHVTAHLAQARRILETASYSIAQEQRTQEQMRFAERMGRRGED